VTHKLNGFNSQGNREEYSDSGDGKDAKASAHGATVSQQGFIDLNGIGAAVFTQQVVGELPPSACAER
jgi:hypothetical protein